MYKVIIRNGSVFGTEPCSCEFVCDTTDDVSTLPTSITKGTGGKTKYDNQVCGSGSIAVVVDNGTNPKRYILDNQDVWCPQPAEGGGGSAQDLSGYAKKTDIPTELPANGGNADTVNNHTIESDVPTNAVFTDTWRGIQNNLTSDSTTDSLSAAQGKILKGLVDATTNRIINNNLLINPDFKINQRSISGTFSETGKYFVDRWKLTSGTVTMNADGTLTLNGTISQIFENAVGTNVVASVSAGTAVYNNNTKTFSITANGETVSWAKLEYGSTATQFIPPDTAAELLKCMRYYEILLPSAADRGVVGYLETNMSALFDIKFSVPKRCPPTLMSSMARIIVNTIGSYIEISNYCAIKQDAVDNHGIIIYTADPIISSSPTGYIAVTMDAMSVTDIAVDAEIY